MRIPSLVLLLFVAAAPAAGAPLAYITEQGADSVEVVDVENWKVIETINVGRKPAGVAVAPGGETNLRQQPGRIEHFRDRARGGFSPPNDRRDFRLAKDLWASRPIGQANSSSSPTGTAIRFMSSTRPVSRRPAQSRSAALPRGWPSIPDNSRLLSPTGRATRSASSTLRASPRSPRCRSAKRRLASPLTPLAKATASLVSSSPTCSPATSRSSILSHSRDATDQGARIPLCGRRDR